MNHGPGIKCNPCFRNGPLQNGRSGGIRTHDPLTPSQVRYRTALRSDLPKRLEFLSFLVGLAQGESRQARTKRQKTSWIGKLWDTEPHRKPHKFLASFRRGSLPCWKGEQRMEDEAAARPHAELISELLDPTLAKSEYEHAAAREIEKLRAENHIDRAVLDTIRQAPNNVGWHCSLPNGGTLKLSVTGRWTSEDVSWLEQHFALALDVVRRAANAPIPFHTPTQKSEGE